MGQPRCDELERTIKAYPVVSIDEDTTIHWADLKAACRDLGVVSSDNDLWVAATSRRLGVPVAALDHDFARVPGPQLIDASGTVKAT